MAEEVHVSDPPADEAGETIHLPGPSYLPVATAFGLTIAIVGVVLSWVIVGIGAGDRADRDRALDRRDAAGDLGATAGALALAHGVGFRDCPVLTRYRCSIGRTVDLFSALRLGARGVARQRRRGPVRDPAAHDVAHREHADHLAAVHDHEVAEAAATIASAARSSDQSGAAKVSFGDRWSRTSSVFGSWPSPTDWRTSRSVMIPGPGCSGSITTAAPTLRSAIDRAASCSVTTGAHGHDHAAHPGPNLHAASSSASGNRLNSAYPMIRKRRICRIPS